MNLKRRLQKLECAPFNAASKAVSPEIRRLILALEQTIRRRREDPEGCERRRQESLRRSGFPEGYNPTLSEILQRRIARRASRDDQSAMPPQSQGPCSPDGMGG